MKIGLFTSLWCCVSFFIQAQTDNVGPGHALHLNGIDQYVDLGNIYDDLTLPLTISAWVRINPDAPNSAMPILTTQDNADLYNGISLFVQKSAIIFEYGDGFGNNSPVYRKGKIASFNNVEVAGRWVHVCGVMRSVTDIQIYVNGVDIGGGLSGASSEPMSSNYPFDVAKVGYFYSNGVTYRFNGSIDELRVWNRGLSANEVKDGMCKKLIGNEPGLIGYWNFNETTGNTIIDKSPNGFTGQFVGNPVREFSGAPIGDVSTYVYPPASSGTALFLEEQNLKITISNISGGPQGAHIYAVRDAPSQQQGLDQGKVNKPYFGAFLASLSVNGTFNTDISYGGILGCNAFQRTANNDAVWNSINLPFTNPGQRAEYVPNSSTTFALDLGDDISECVFTPRVLRPTMDTINYDFTWQDGSKKPTYPTSDFGVYWVIVKNYCGEASDSIRISKKADDDWSTTPDVLTPNGDNKNDYFIVHSDPDNPILLQVFNRWGKEVFHSEGYKNDWDGGDLSSGTYFVKITGVCAEFKEWLTIIR